MITTIAVSIGTCLLIWISQLLLPKIKIGKITLDTYWIIALLGATILLTFSFAPISEVWSQFTSKSAINPIKILVLFFSMTLLSTLLDEFGLFQLLASLTIIKAKGSQFKLFVLLYILVSILTVFTSNDVVILTLTPFICFFCKRAKINPLPFLIAEFTAANTWSLMFIIGNPTNIFLATSAKIDFVEYFRVMALPTLAAGLVEFFIIFLIFRRKLKEHIEVTDQEDYKVESKTSLIVGVVHLAVCLIFLIIGSYIFIEMWLVSLVCGVSLLVYVIFYSIFAKKNRECVKNTAKRLPYPLIPFFLSMFVIVVALNCQGVSDYIASFFGSGNTIWIYGYSSFLASNVMNNIPMSILYSKLCLALPQTAYRSAVFASIIGSNIGAFLTPMGALAGIMFTNLLNKHDLKFTFLDFIKYGSIVAIPTITAALGMLFFVL